MMELGSVERRIIKRDAKMVVTDHALAFFLVSLPVTILELLFVFRAAFSAPEWVKWIVIGLLAVFLYLPLTIGQVAYLLGEIREDSCVCVDYAYAVWRLCLGLLPTFSACILWSGAVRRIYRKSWGGGIH